MHTSILYFGYLAVCHLTGGTIHGLGIGCQNYKLSSGWQHGAYIYM